MYIYVYIYMCVCAYIYVPGGEEAEPAGAARGGGGDQQAAVRGHGQQARLGTHKHGEVNQATVQASSNAFMKIDHLSFLWATESYKAALLLRRTEG
jgi:hypothetical protein